MKAIWYILPLVVALALLGGLWAATDVAWADIAEVFATLEPLPLVGVFLCILALVTLSAVKWRMVMEALGEAPQGWSVYLFYTSLGAALSLVFVIHVSVPMARALGTKLHLDRPIATGVGASVYEQVFDVLVLLVFTLPAIAMFFWGLSVSSALWLALACFAGGGVLLITLLNATRLTTARLIPRLAPILSSAALTAPRFIARIYMISVARYVLLMVQAFLVLVATNLPISWPDFGSAFALVQLSKLIAITPAGLGVAEITWSAILSSMGYPAGDALKFVIANRATSSAALLAVFVLIAALVMLFKPRKSHA